MLTPNLVAWAFKIKNTIWSCPLHQEAYFDFYVVLSVLEITRSSAHEQVLPWT